MVGEILCFAPGANLSLLPCPFDEEPTSCNGRAALQDLDST